MTTGPMPSSTRPLVSISMGVYNAEAYVTQTIQSLLNQDYPHIELLISDNGSEDRSSEICRRFAERDPRVIYSRNEVNINPCKNAENMLFRTTGQYHMWAADHDIYHPKYISSLLNIFKNEDESLVLAYPNSCQIDKNNKPFREIEEDIDTRGLSAAERFKKVLWGISSCTSMYGLFRSSALKDAFELRWIIGPDVVFLPEFSLKGTFAHHTETLFFWRQNRPVESYFELNDRQADLLMRNEVEKLAPAMMRDYELLKVVRKSGLPEQEIDELLSEVLKRHRKLPEYKLSREVRYLLHKGLKFFELEGGLDEISGNIAHDYYRVGQIAKLFCNDFAEELNKLCRLCIPYLEHRPYELSISGLLYPDEDIDASSGFDGLIPPEIKNDAFYKDIEHMSSQEGVVNILEIGSSAGEGSTAAFADGIKAGPNDARLYCMEISEARHRALEQRYADDDNVICCRASSVSLKRFPSDQHVRDFYRSTRTALNRYPLEQVLGWLRQDKTYLSQSRVSGNGIAAIKEEHGIDTFDLVLIDGSEFTGIAELDDVYGAKVIMLDDINTYKNYENYHRLKKDPNYRLEKENWRLRNGYAIFRIKEDEELPIHFFTIVLNGEPFIRYHLELFKKLELPWHWHIIEGVADLKHDTGWSLPLGGRIPEKYHQNGLSVDGTTAYLDRIALENPDRVSLYRKTDGGFWDGKLEMVNAPLKNLPQHCLLWQVDADELWQKEQIETAHRMFVREPERTAALFHCHFFVTPDLLTTTPGTYSHNTAYEWIRLWRYQAGMQWKSHEPPSLMQKKQAGWIDMAQLSPFSHQETEAAGLVFSHYAYALASQVSFKEDYYGYKGAVRQWHALQAVQELPVKLSSYFGWVNDGTMVDRIENRTIGRSVPPVEMTAIPGMSFQEEKDDPPHLVLDGVIFQLQAGRSQGITRVWSNLIAELTRQYPKARFTVLQRDGFPVPLPEEQVQRVPAYQLGNEANQDADDLMLRKVCCDLGADLFVSTYYTRAPGVPNVVMIHDLIPERFGFDLSQPEWLSKKRAIETGDGFMCVSRTTRDDLIQYYPRAQNAPTAIIPNGLDLCFKPSGHSAVQELKLKLGITGDYLLLVGNRHGYKNGVGVLKALSQLASRSEFSVLCVGGEQHPSGQEMDLKRSLDLHYAGQMSDADLAIAYSGAKALLVPSKYEGFGLPVIEAMACGCPVIAEKSSAVKEVGGDAVIYAEMDQPSSVEQALGKLKDAPFRREIVNLGKSRSAGFKWAETGGRFVKFLKDVNADQSILLTAIVSTYNAAHFIRGCLDDLVQQTIGTKLEIIVVDSNSKEDEASIVRDFQRQNANIKYIRTRRRENVYRAWNRGIKFAVGKYVTNANTDDRHRRDAYELMVDVLEANESIALVYADVIKTQSANETFRHCTPTGVYRWYDWDRNKLLEKGCFIGPQPVWRKAVHREYGYFDDNYDVSADFEFWLRISQSNDFIHIDKPLGLYMDRPDSIEHANTSKKLQEDKEILSRYRLAARENKTIGPLPDRVQDSTSDSKPMQKEKSNTQQVSVGDDDSTNETITQGGHYMYSPETIFKSIEHLVENGHNESALWVLDKLLSDFPDNARWHNELASLAYEQSDTQKALAHFQKAVEIEPENAMYLKNLADYCYVVEKDAEKALTLYEQVLRSDPNQTESLILAGHLSVSLHLYSQGERFYARAMDLDPQNTEVRQIMEKISQTADDQGSQNMSTDDLYAAAGNKREEGDVETAIKLLEQLLARDETHALAHNDLGVLEYEKGNMQSALTHYEKATSLQPENETFLKNLADFYLAVMEDPHKALAILVQVLKCSPLDVEAMLSCALICQTLGKTEDAKDFVKAGLEAEPWNENAQKLMQQLENVDIPNCSDATSLYETAKSKAAGGDLESAIGDLAAYIGMAPDDANAHNDLGVLYYETGEKEKAIVSYERAVQLEPKDTTYLKNLADIYLMEQGRIEEAMKLYLVVLTEQPEDIEPLLACGMISSSVGQHEDAKHFYHRVLEIEPWNETARKGLEGISAATDEQARNGYDTAAAG